MIFGFLKNIISKVFEIFYYLYTLRSYSLYFLIFDVNKALFVFISLFSPVSLCSYLFPNLFPFISLFPPV